MLDLFRMRKLMMLLPQLEKFMEDKNPAIEVLVQNLVYEVSKELNEMLDGEEIDL